MEGKQTTLGANTGCIYAAPSGGTGGPKRLLRGPSGPRGRRAGAELQPPPVTSVTSLSSRVALDEVLHLAPEVLLVPQVMLRSLDIQWVIKVQEISKQRV